VDVNQKMKEKILWLSDSPTTPTGYGTITRKVLNGLSKEFECHSIGHNYFGLTLQPPISFEDNEKIDFVLHGAGKAKYSMDAIKQKIDKYNIDYFGFLLDTFMVFEAGFMNVDTSPAKTFFYFPSDGGGGLPRGCEQILKKINYPIAMAKFGKRQVEKMYGIKCEYIPHGVDTNIFYPLSKKEKEKLREMWMFQNKFVVGVVARNQPRKMLDRTIKAFAKFSEGKDDCILLLHCDPTDNAAVFSISDMIKDFGIQNKVIFTGTSFFNPFNYKQMNEVYNIMDVFLLSTSGEGFGIPTVEAMACGVPQILTDYTTSHELIIENGQTGELVKLSGEKDFGPFVHCKEILTGTITGTWQVERGLMDIYHCSEILNKLYNDKKLLEKYSKEGIKKVKKYYDWKVIMPMWKNFFRRIKNE